MEWRRGGGEWTVEWRRGGGGLIGGPWTERKERENGGEESSGKEMREKLRVGPVGFQLFKSN